MLRLDELVANGWAPEAPSEPNFGKGTISHARGNQEFIMALLKTIAIRQSFEFTPDIPQSVVDAVLCGIVPQEVLPRLDDDQKVLATRIALTQFFDELMVLKGGGSQGGKRIPLNETCYSQPRRKSWSIVADDVHMNDKKQLVRTMYGYGKRNSRIRTDVMATPMPWPIFELGLQCFLAVRHVLTKVCASSPPNHCQMLAYYGLFDSKCGRHKDDHELQVLHKVLLNCMTAEEATNTTKGTMLPGADVLIYSAGPLPVLFSWCFTREGQHFVGRELHEIHPLMQLDLPHGSVFVFKAIDDLHFYHEVGIMWKYAKPTDHRFAFVFRWLGEAQEMDFAVHDSLHED